jgi:DNA-binding MarR family transcriptional regulator
VSEKDAAIARIMKSQDRFYHLLAFDRSDPLLTVHLTMPQLKALLVLSLRPEASGQDVMSAMGISLATITGIMDRLAAQGLVTRREDPRDRRVRRLELTAAGRELIDRILTAGAAHQRRLLTRLGVQELQIVERALELMLEAAAAERADAENDDHRT